MNVQVGERLLASLKNSGGEYFTFRRYLQPVVHGVTPHNDKLIAERAGLGDIFTPPKDRRQVTALGALIYGGILQIIDDDSERGSEDIDILAEQLAPYFTYQIFLPLEVENLIEKPKSENVANLDYGFMGLIDFDCVPTALNLNRVVDRLSGFRYRNWELYDSGGGFHLYFLDGGFSGAQLIQLYGELIGLFAEESGGAKGHIFHSYARDLIKGAEPMDIYGGGVMMKDIQKIRKTCREMLAQVGHYDDRATDKLAFMLDLRNIAHAILEVLEFDRGNDLSFPALRINKGKYSHPPLLVAESNDGEVKVIDSYQSDYEKMNPRIPGL